MGRSFVVVEGHGEVDAVLNLLHRLSEDLGFEDTVWALAGRCNALLRKDRVLQECEKLRARRDCDRVLFLQDDEDGCPKDDGPRLASWIREAALPFPAAVTLFYREYETLFLPCLPAMAGKTLRDGRGRELHPLHADARFDGDPEGPRDAKKVLSRFFPTNHPYRETTHQVALTRLLDFATLRSSGLPSFGTLERALRFILAATTSGTYPVAPAGGA